MNALEKNFMGKADRLDPKATFEAYLRVVPVLAANILTSTDLPSGKFLATLIFKQVVLVEKTLSVPGLLDFVTDTTETLVYSIHGVKKGQTFDVTGGANGDELALVPASDTSVNETLAQKLERRRMEAELAQLDAAEKEAKARATAAEAASSAIVARANKEKRESTLIGQVFTPENVIDIGVSSMFSGAVCLAAWTSVKIAGKVAVGTVAAAGGLVQAGAQEAVSAAAGLATSAKDAVAETVAKANPANLLTSLNPWATPTPTPTATPTPQPEPVNQVTFLDQAGQNADGISGGLFNLLQLPFRQISTTDQIVLAISMFMIVDIATILVIKVGRKAFAKETSLVEVMSAIKGNPKAEQDQRMFLENVGGRTGVPAIANAPAPAPTPAIKDRPLQPVKELIEGGRKRKTFRNRKNKKPKTLRNPTFVY